MSINGLFDARVNIYRQDQSSIDDLGAVPPTPALSSPNVPASLQTPTRLRSTDEGAGERLVGFAHLYVDKRVDVALGDIIKVVSGPNTGSLWSVIGVFVPSRSRHHNECTLKPYIGASP